MILKNEKLVPEALNCTPRQCAGASALFKSRVLNPAHLNQVFKEKKEANEMEEDDVLREEEAQYIALKMEKSVEKHRMKKNQDEVVYGHGYSTIYPHKSTYQPYQ